MYSIEEGQVTGFVLYFDIILIKQNISTLLETSASKNNIKDVRQRSNLCNMTQKTIETLL